MVRDQGGEVPDSVLLPLAGTPTSGGAGVPPQGVGVGSAGTKKSVLWGDGSQGQAGSVPSLGLAAGAQGGAAVGQAPPVVPPDGDGDGESVSGDRGSALDHFKLVLRPFFPYVRIRFRRLPRLRPRSVVLKGCLAKG